MSENNPLDNIDFKKSVANRMRKEIIRVESIYTNVSRPDCETLTLS